MTVCTVYAGRGTGIAVTQNVEAGQLLAIANPLGIAYMESCSLGVNRYTCRLVRQDSGVHVSQRCVGLKR